MKKLIALTILVLFTIFIVACQTPEPESNLTEEEVAEESLDDDLSEIDSLVEDLYLEEIDEIDQALAELE